MAFFGPEDVEKLLAPGVDDAVLLRLYTAHTADANRQLRKWLGSRAEEEEADPSMETRNAGALLVLYYGLPVMNMRLTSRGGLVTATGFDQARQELMSAGQLQQTRNMLYRQARRLVQDGAEVGLWAL